MTGPDTLDPVCSNIRDWNRNLNLTSCVATRVFCKIKAIVLQLFALSGVKGISSKRIGSQIL